MSVDYCDPVMSDLLQLVDLSADDTMRSQHHAADDSMSYDEEDVSRDKTDCHSENGDNVYIEDLDSSDFRVVAEYRSILSHFHELPRDVFLAQIVRDYASPEPDLERVRDVYFEHLTDITSNFPYEDAYTHSGDPVPVRLAQDIHNILQVHVVEGGDPAILKNIISVACAKARLTNSVRRSVVRRRSAATGTPRQGGPPTACSCASELKLLKDSVATLKGDTPLPPCVLRTALF